MGKTEPVTGSTERGSCLAMWFKILPVFQDHGPPCREDLSRGLVLYNELCDFRQVTYPV